MRKVFSSVKIIRQVILQNKNARSLAEAGAHHILHISYFDNIIFRVRICPPERKRQ